MKLTSLKNLPIQSPAVALAQLCEPHGYRFEGDLVHLNTKVALLDPAAHDFSWALQLWACADPPTSAHELAGHIVAEAALPAIGEIADEYHRFEAGVFAWPPAGPAAHVMVLVLTSGAAGQFSVVHDIAVYPCRQQFVQPRMRGTVDYLVNGGEARIAVECVENPRPAGNQSGTLSLELWALPDAFSGGHFEGHHLAGVEVGSIGGQSELALQPIDVHFIPPPAGAWQIVLMLREWTAEGFLTRDFRGFAAPLVIDPVVERTVPLVQEPPGVQLSEKPPPEAAAAAPAEEPAVASVSAPPTDATLPDPGEGRLSINTAGVDELAAVKGLTKKIAEGIVKKRPFASLDDLHRVKGIGSKLLAKVRSKLKL